MDYLGPTFTSDSKEDAELQKRMSKESKATGALKPTLKSKMISKKAKIEPIKQLLDQQQYMVVKASGTNKAGSMRAQSSEKGLGMN